MTITEIQSGALKLPEDQRAALIAELLGSLPAVLSDIDDGSDEAARRIAEIKVDPACRRTWDQVKAEFGRSCSSFGLVTLGLLGGYPQLSSPWLHGQPRR
jgi:putative addiction module component (TIGR02574 family)